LLLPYQQLLEVGERGTDINTPVGTLWDVPNGVCTWAYVDIALLYDLIKG